MDSYSISFEDGMCTIDGLQNIYTGTYIQLY